MIDIRKKHLKRPFLILGVAILVGIGVAGYSVMSGWMQANAADQGPKPRSEVLRMDSLGHIDAGKRILRMRIVTFEPGGETGWHSHDIPGSRYVLEGQLTIIGKDGTSNTYKAGDTYFAGPIGGTPQEQHKAKVTGKDTYKVLIVELLPEEKE